MDMNLLLDAELRAATADAKCEVMADAMQTCKMDCAAQVETCRAEIESLRTRLQAEQLTTTDLSARLESERAERVRADKILDKMLQQMKDMMPVEEPVEVPASPEWEFRINRDGANQMIGVTAITRSGNG